MKTKDEKDSQTWPEKSGTQPTEERRSVHPVASYPKQRRPGNSSPAARCPDSMGRGTRRHDLRSCLRSYLRRLVSV